MNMSKSRGIQAKIPSPKVIYASNESKSVLARNLEECRDNDKNSQSVILSFKCILASICEGTEQLRHIYIKRFLPTLPVISYKSSAFPLRDLKNVCIFSPYEL